MPSTPISLPGQGLDIAKMPGHWLLARLGKRVLRPGGLELTKKMLKGLRLSPGDDVVEFAPGLGATTKRALALHPRSYVAVDRDEQAVAQVRRVLRSGDRCVCASANDTGLPEASASVVFGEAMLTMQPATKKSAIVREAARLLRPGGRYGIHEMGLAPDDLPLGTKAKIQASLSEAIRVGARPLTRSEWTTLLEDEGFEIESIEEAPMHLLEPKRVVQDEGLFGALRIASRIATNPAARARVLKMRAAFQSQAEHLCAFAIVARKKGANP